MSLMDKMMERMIKNMTVEEKEQAMLKMMPMMMEGMDIKRLVPGMLSAAGSLISLTSIFQFITTALTDQALKEKLDGVLKTKPGDIKNHLPLFAEKMQSMCMRMTAMPDIMSGMMDFMIKNVMPVMMPVMRKMMPIMMKEKMPEMMQKHDIMKEMMPSMMMEIMPDCVETMVPMIEQEKQAEFVSRMSVAMGKAGVAIQNK